MVDELIKVFPRFSRDMWFRCFDHIIDLGVKAFLDRVTSISQKVFVLQIFLLYFKSALCLQMSCSIFQIRDSERSFSNERNVILRQSFHCKTMEACVCLHLWFRSGIMVDGDISRKDIEKCIQNLEQEEEKILLDETKLVTTDRNQLDSSQQENRRTRTGC